MNRTTNSTTAAAHTPGPWYLRVNTHRNCDGSKWGWVDTQQAGCQRPPSGVSVGWSEGETSFANACLVVAAPDMLAALKRLLSLAKKQLDQSATHDGMTNCGAIAAARHAIARAEGQAVKPGSR